MTDAETTPRSADQSSAAPALLQRSDRVGVPAFDLTGPLPRGTTNLEASAGTGKTHTIAALVTRYVAEGRASLDELLVVTFSRSASQELRERVREYLVRATTALADPVAARQDDDDVIRHLATPGPSTGATDASGNVVAQRRRRLLAARADFDAATIVTTHGFCQLVLTSLGVAGDNDSDISLVEDLSDLVDEVVDDLYLQGFAGRHAGTGPPFLDRDEAGKLGRQVVDDPQSVLAPSGTDLVDGSVAARRVRFASAVRAEVDRRKRRRRVLGYDDLLARLAAALGDPDAPALARMRHRWNTVLVDEFQDTDPVQWEILSRAFAGVATLVLVGDPKQAIYAFRGGDVHTYLQATAAATSHATLDVNRRSDGPLVDALQVLLGGLELGDPRIPVRPVTAAHQGSRLAGAPVSAPVRLRVLSRQRHDTPPRGRIKVGSVRPFVARDLAADIAELLASPATWDDRPLQAGDVAVLVAKHSQAELVRQALAGKGIPAVVAGPSNVYAAPAGTDWLTLLEALEQPHRSARARSAALTPFVGRTAAELDAGGEGLTDELSALFARWAELLAERGVAALMEVAEIDQGLPGRVLATPDGERRMTDLRHVGEALHNAAVTEGLGVGALTEWLRDRRRERPGGAADERIRRLETDAAAVQVLTVHASKGLQFPVVYLPYAFDRWVADDVDPVRFHDPETGRRTLDVGGPGSPGRSEREVAALAEDAAESLRLLYVGLTRARSQVVLWWAPATTAECSALHRVLFGRRPEAGSVPDRVPLESDDKSRQLLTRMERAGGLSVEDAAISASPAVRTHRDPVDQLAVSTLDRRPQTGWRRVSYTSLSSAASAGPEPVTVGSEPESREREDEDLPVTAVVAPLAGGAPDAEGDDLAGSAAATLPLSPMGQLPVGAAFGTLVHAVLETANPQAPDLAAELLLRCREQVPRHAQALDPNALAAALLPVLRTPLGPLADDRTLADVGLRDRLAELTFEMPLCGGDLTAVSDDGLTLGRLAALLRDHLVPDDPLVGYADRLADPGLSEQVLHGYLTGSLDLVLRIPGPDGPRYLVADYKTNWLGDLDDAPASRPGSAGRTSAPPASGPAPGVASPPDLLLNSTTAARPAGPDVSAYRPFGLAAAMAGSDYPLQALLYAVALHRFLRWRQPGYDPEVHLGGVLYLFIRGMCGPDTPIENGQRYGVFGWQPPVSLVTAVSDLLGGAS